MPRKSRELRLSQTKKLVETYNEAGISHVDRSFRFMNDMIIRLERGKGLSTGQRKYLDNLIDLGIPKLKNEERVNEILEAAKVDGMQQVSSTLNDFAYKIGKGWSLSEKQAIFLTSLLSKAEQLKTEGRFRPTGELLEDLKAAVSICRLKNGWYWHHRPGTAKAYGKVESWLAWMYMHIAKDSLGGIKIDQSLPIEDEPIIDQWACDKLLKAVKNPLSELKNPKHAEGAIVWRVLPGGIKTCAIITGAPGLHNGVVIYPALVSGSDIQVPLGDIRKRR